MYGWAPLAILGEEINKLEASSHGQAYSSLAQDGPLEMGRLSLDSIHEPLHAGMAQRLDEGNGSATGDMAGVYLGIWNIFATIPQFLATFISMVAFSILEPGKSPELTQGEEVAEPDAGDAARRLTQGLSGTAVCLAIGAVCSFVAATRTFRLRKI